MNHVSKVLACTILFTCVTGCAVAADDDDDGHDDGSTATTQEALVTAPGADLRINAFTQTVRTDVDAYQQLSITVQNYGTAKALSSTLRVDLLATMTSPATYLLGEVQALPTGCTISGRVLTCQLGLLKHNGPVAGRRRTISFGYRIPVTTQTLGLTASVASPSEPAANTTDNSAGLTAAVDHRAPVVQPGVRTASHCTGTGLTAYFECTKSPSSISTHQAEYHAGGAITFPGISGYTGSWSQTDPTSLHVEYDNGSFSEMVFDGRGADGACFEGIAHFFYDHDGDANTPPVASSYNAAYRICF